MRHTSGTPSKLEPGWWRDNAECRDMDGDLFFPSNGRIPPAAAAACSRCAVRAECLAFATSTMQTHGIWAGLTPHGLEQVRLGRRTA